MTLSGLSVKRKIAMGCFIAMLVYFGALSYFKVGMDTLPKMDVPYVQVLTIYPGASPEEVETDVAKRIEDAVASLDGMKHITSTCMENVCSTTMEFVNGTDVDIMIHEVRERLNTVVDEFPPIVKTPLVSKVNINALPVVTLYLTGGESVDELYHYADKTLSDYFASIPGVGEIRLHGGNEMQLHVLLDRDKLSAMNLTVAQIVAAIQENNLKLPAGHILENGRETAIAFDSEFHDIRELGEFEIGVVGGHKVYLGDVAEIKLMAKEIRQEGYFNREPGIAMEIVKKVDANTVEVIKQVRKRFDAMQTPGALPRNTQLIWFKDNADYIQASVKDAWASVGLGILLTALLLFLFLHEPRSTFIIAVSMPVSVIITFSAMALMHYTFNMMTLVAIGCSSGILVTNSVIVMENIFVWLKRGKSPKKSAAEGTAEVINAVSASALTNVVVFVPIASMTSVVGMLVGPFAGVMVIATLASLFISFTLTPILASLLLKAETGEGNTFWNRFFRFWDFGYDHLAAGFNRTMVWTRRYPKTVILISLVLCVALLYQSIPNLRISGVPFYDKNEVSLFLEFPSDYGIDATREQTLALVDELLKRPDVDNVGSVIGYRSVTLGQIPESVNLAEVTIMLKPMGTRAPIKQIMDEIRQDLAKKSGFLYAVSQPTPIGAAGQELTGYIGGPELDVLEKYANEAADLMRRSGMATDVDTSCRSAKPRIKILPERALLKNLGVPVTAMGISIVGYFDGVEAGSFKVGVDTFDIRVKMKGKEGLDQLQEIPAVPMNGKPVSLSALTTMQNSPVAISLVRQDKERAAWFYANSAPGHSMDDLTRLLRKELAPKLPQGYQMVFTGQSEMVNEGAMDFVMVLITAVFLTFLVIAAIMESLSRPFLVMFTIPLGFVGFFAMLYFTGTLLSMVGMLGGIMMIGIVVNNAILIMDETTTLTASGMKPYDAMLRASQKKFRPILMTSIASVIGMLPMAFGRGIGYEIRSSCGIGVVGGLLFAMFLTLYFIPALFYVSHRRQRT